MSDGRDRSVSTDANRVCRDALPAIALTGIARRARVAVAIVLAVSLMFGPAAYGVDAVGGTSVDALAPDVVAQAPSVAAPVGILVAEDGRELWSRSPQERRAMASTTKIMTAVLALERASLDESVTVSPDAVSVGESAAGLRAGDRLSMG